MHFKQFDFEVQDKEKGLIFTQRTQVQAYYYYNIEQSPGDSLVLPGPYHAGTSSEL